MDQDKDRAIRERAYAMWEQEGRPEDRHDHHWAQAESELNDGSDMEPDLQSETVSEPDPIASSGSGAQAAAEPAALASEPRRSGRKRKDA